MAFYVGQKVVCVDAKGLDWGNYPKEGEVYTIRECLSDPSNEPVIRLIEIVNNEGPNFTLNVYCEPYYRASRFRPIVSRPTSISIFTAMLGPTKVREDA